jgi:hypothetical protein
MSVDFQRLAEVRARQSSRRRQWHRRLSAVGVVALAVAASQLAIPLFPGRLLAPAIQSGVSMLNSSVVSPDSVSSPDEEARGRVAIVEPAARRIRVSSGFLGLISIDLVVTNDTLIVVGDKEGGFGDIRHGSEVRAAYEGRPGALRATRVEVVLDSPSVPRTFLR